MQKSGTETSSFGTNGRINHNSEKFYDSRLYKQLIKAEPVSKEVKEFPIELLNKNILGSA